MKYTNKMKVAGEFATRLLSDKAAAFYNQTDPLAVYEYETGSGKLYTVTGVIEAEGLTFKQLDDLLTDYYNIVNGD